MVDFFKTFQIVLSFSVFQLEHFSSILQKILRVNKSLVLISTTGHLQLPIKPACCSYSYFGFVL